MSAIYFHIPICQTRCSYCAFYSTTAHVRKAELVDALLSELRTRQDFLSDKQVSTIYFGGGTPSLLSPEDVGRCISLVRELYHVDTQAEITLESNPDDLSAAYLTALRAVGVNRLSIGVQSFDDEVLRFANRRHTAAQAIEAVRLSAAAGFDNISIDLMYGFPCQSPESWQNTVDQALRLPVQHISAYDLTYEEGTVLWQRLQDGLIDPIDDDAINTLHDTMVDRLAAEGFEHYEVSNFSLPGFHSRHNSSYWVGVPYLGLGPAAHSYDGERVRRWNVESLDRYLSALRDGQSYSEQETLTDDDRYNEFVMLALRTMRGIDMRRMASELGESRVSYCLRMAEESLRSAHLEFIDNYLRTTKKGLKILNLLTEKLMV